MSDIQESGINKFSYKACIQPLVEQLPLQVEFMLCAFHADMVYDDIVNATKSVGRLSFSKNEFRAFMAMIDMMGNMKWNAKQFLDVHVDDFEVFPQLQELMLPCKVVLDTGNVETAQDFRVHVSDDWISDAFSVDKELLTYDTFYRVEVGLFRAFKKELQLVPLSQMNRVAPITPEFVKKMAYCKWVSEKRVRYVPCLIAGTTENALDIDGVVAMKAWIRDYFFTLSQK